MYKNDSNFCCGESHAMISHNKNQEAFFQLNAAVFLNNPY
jgi:hypothetical protein